jgi:NADH-quinone oxidoreductase subunit C
MSADLVSTLQARFPRLAPRPSADHPAVNAPLEDVVPLLRCLRDEHGFDLLTDVTAIDWAPGASPRFTVVYHLLSTTRAGAYVRVAAPCAGPEEAPVAPTVTGLWAGADWHERECYDLMGVRFEGHPDLRRILMWDGYPYHPLRKDFPLAGIETELPAEDVAAETGARVVAAPMAGGPFVASAGEINLTEAEPRAKDESWSDRAPQPGHTPLRQVKE